MTDRDKIIGEISKSYIFVENGRFQILYETHSGEFYCTTNGGFGQRDTYIESVPKSIATNIINKSQSPVK